MATRGSQEQAGTARNAQGQPETTRDSQKRLLKRVAKDAEEYNGTAGSNAVEGKGNAESAAKVKGNDHKGKVGPHKGKPESKGKPRAPREARARTTEAAKGS